MTRRRAFTLIELLVVISIISLLISLLLPALAKARESVNLVKCMSNQRQIIIAVLTYAADDKNGSFPPSTASRVVGSSVSFTMPVYINYTNAFANGGKGWQIKELLGNYISNGLIFACPLAPDSGAQITQNAFERGFAFASNALSSYELLWNYKQWDEDVVPGSSAHGSFVAPGSVEEVNADDLIIADALAWGFGGAGYISPHGQGVVLHPNYPYYGLADDLPQSLPINGGYRDGSVSTMQAGELTKNTLPWFPGIWMYLPERNP